MFELGALRTELNNLMAAVQLVGEQVEAVAREVGRLTDPEARTGPGNGRSSSNGTRGKASGTRLEVRLGGETYSSRCAADTLADVVAAIGPERIEALGLRLGGRQLVSRTRPANSRGHRKRGNWYIYIHSDTAAKRAVLEKIGRAFGLPVTVRIVT